MTALLTVFLKLLLYIGIVIAGIIAIIVSWLGVSVVWSILLSLFDMFKKE